MKAVHELTSVKRGDKIKLQVLIGMLSLVSFYTSYTGFLKLAGVTKEDYLLIGMMAILVATLQYALVFSINAFYIKDLFGKRAIKTVSIFSIYLITMLSSITFSFSYWYQEFSSEGYAERSTDLQLSSMKDRLITAQNAFSHVATTLQHLSDYSLKKSTQEKNVGYTCSSKVGRGEGPYTWLRADDATLTRAYLDDIQALKQQLNQEIGQVTRFVESFDPNGDIEAFNRTVNDNVQRINAHYFKNQILVDLKDMLLSRSGQSRQAIQVTSRKTGAISTEQCMDSQFTHHANRVIAQLNALKAVEKVDFFDRGNTKELFSRTINVLMALLNPSTIKSVDQVKHPDDITTADLYAISAGFLIDLLILFVTLYAKEPRRENLVSKQMMQTVKGILDGKYSNELFNKLKPYLADIHGDYLIAIPNKEDKEIDNLKLLMLYMQRYKIATLYINNHKDKPLAPWFQESLEKRYPGETFKIYKVPRKKFEAFILQNIIQGEHHV